MRAVFSISSVGSLETGQNPPSCDPNKWCAAVNIFSFTADQTCETQMFNNPDCESLFTDEPDNFAWVTLVSGSIPFATSDVMRMNPGDRLGINMLDTPQGFQVSITDFSTGQQGTMTASAANGFEHVVFDPHAASCTTTPYTFHPMFATSSEQTRVWTAHTYNIGFAAEIGHQDLSGYNNTADGDSSFQGPSYLHDWPGSLSQPQDAQVHSSPIEFTSPVTTPRRPPPC